MGMLMAETGASQVSGFKTNAVQARTNLERPEALTTAKALFSGQWYCEIDCAFKNYPVSTKLKKKLQMHKGDRKNSSPASLL